jgi:putative transposase
MANDASIKKAEKTPTPADRILLTLDNWGLIRVSPDHGTDLVDWSQNRPGTWVTVEDAWRIRRCAMPWKKMTPMTERLSLIELYQTRLWRMPERCTRFNISRTTGNTWRRRDAPEGVSGLQEQCRAPRSCPHRLAPEVAAVRWAAKPRHPSGGPRQLLPSLTRDRPALEWPAARRAGERCRTTGWSRSTPRRRRPPPPGAPALPAGAPNEGWTAEFTGPCRPGDGVDGSPHTGADAYARALLGGTARLSTTPVEAPPLFARLFHA